MKSWLFYILVSGLGALPLAARRALARGAGALVALFPSREQRVCTLHLRHFLPQSGASTSRVYQHLVTVLLESFNLNQILADKRYLDDSALTGYWDNRDPARGIIALSAHLGNWELVAAAAIRHKVPLQVVGREARQSAWQDTLERIRKQYGAEILWRSDSAAVKKMIGLLKSGSVIAALIDQDTDVRSDFIPFFGRPAKTPSALIELGIRTGAVFVTAFTIRKPDGQYQIMVDEVQSTRESSVASVLSLYHQRLEALVRQYPDQWAWVHKRWRSLEDGRRLSSREYIELLEGLS